jgi:hypothetical protein
MVAPAAAHIQMQPGMTQEIAEEHLLRAIGLKRTLRMMDGDFHHNVR